LATGAREVIDRYGLLPPPGDHDIAPCLWLEREDQVVFSASLGDTTALCFRRQHFDGDETVRMRVAAL